MFEKKLNGIAKVSLFIVGRRNRIFVNQRMDCIDIETERKFGQQKKWKTNDI